MIKALITKKAMLTVEPGSIVEISEGQFKALGGIAVAYKEEAKEVEEPKASASKKTSRKKKSED